jgi:hypothetical protein
MQWYKNRIYYWKHSKCVRKETKDEPAKDGGLSQQWWTWLVGWWWMIGALGFWLLSCCTRNEKLRFDHNIGSPKNCCNPVTHQWLHWQDFPKRSQNKWHHIYVCRCTILSIIKNYRVHMKWQSHNKLTLYKVEWLTISAVSASWARTSGQT